MTTGDALGRPISVTTPDGTSTSGYGRATDGVDTVLFKDANDHYTLRSFDGDRVVAVKECTNFACDTSGTPARSMATTRTASSR